MGQRAVCGYCRAGVAYEAVGREGEVGAGAGARHTGRDVSDGRLAVARGGSCFTVTARGKYTAQEEHERTSY